MKNDHTLKFYFDQPTSKGQLYELIDEIMDEFDFERVHKTMEALDWQWREEGIPDTAVLRREARRQLKEVCGLSNELRDPDMDTEYRIISCGGFEAMCEVCPYDDTEKNSPDFVDDTLHQVRVVLRFVVESWGDI